MIWNLRARFLARTADLRSAFSPAMAFLAHQDYPWLLPAAVAQAFSMFGESRIVPAAIAAIFGALAIAVATLGVARAQGARWGLLGGLAVVTLPCFATFASNQQSDVPLAVYFAIAAGLMTSAKSRSELALAAFSERQSCWRCGRVVQSTSWSRTGWTGSSGPPPTGSSRSSGRWRCWRPCQR